MVSICFHILCLFAADSRAAPPPPSPRALEVSSQRLVRRRWDLRRRLGNMSQVGIPWDDVMGLWNDASTMVPGLVNIQKTIQHAHL